MTREPILSRDFAFLFVAHVCSGLSFLLFIHLPSFLKDIGAGEVEIGLIVGTSAISSIALKPAIGRLMDIRGRRPLILVGGLVNLVAVLLYLTVTSLGIWLYAVRVLHGFGWAMIFTPLFTYGADLIPASRRTEGLALFGISGFVSMGLSGVLGDVILGWRGFNELFVAASGFAFMAWFLAMVLPERAPQVAHGDRGRSFFAAIRSAELLPVWFATGIFAVSVTSYFTFLRTYIDEVGFGSVGAFFVAYGVAAVLLRVVFAWLPGRVGEKRVLYPAFAVLGVGFLVLGGARSAGAIVVAGVLTGAGHGYVFPILFGFAVTRARVGDRGSALALFTALIDMGTLVGGPILGLVIARSGYPAMYRSVAVLLMVGAFGFAAWDRRHLRDPAPAASY